MTTAAFYLIAALSLAAQVASELERSLPPDQELSTSSPVVEVRTLEPQDPTPGGVPDETQIRRSDTIEGQRIISFDPDTNDHGHIDFTSPSGYSTSGIFLKAEDGWPDISARIGSTGNGSSFSIFNLNNQLLFKVTGFGFAGIGTSAPSALLDIEKNQDNGTAIELNNGNPGSSSSSAWTSLYFKEGSTLKAAVNSIGSGTTLSPGGPNTLQLWNYQAAPIVFGTSSTERMRIFADGNATIGAVYNVGRLGVFDQVLGGKGLYVDHRSTISSAPSSAQHDVGLNVNSFSNVASGVTTNGSVVGAYLHGYNSGAGTQPSAFGLRLFAGNLTQNPPVAGTVTSAYGAHVQIMKGNGTVTNGYAFYAADVQADNDYAFYQAGTDDSNYFAGDMTVGAPGATGLKLQVNGNVNVTGSVTGATVIGAVYQDVAEWVPATVDMEPGTVVVLNLDRTNEVMPSQTSYDTSVAGVVSAQPGVLLGVAGDSKEQIATTGRVKVRVDATRTPIRVGDLLVTSDVAGTAMRSEAMESNGRRFHQPGTIIGKALEPLASGTGEILVLLSLQ